VNFNTINSPTKVPEQSQIPSNIPKPNEQPKVENNIISQNETLN